MRKQPWSPSHHRRPRYCCCTCHQVCRVRLWCCMLQQWQQRRQRRRRSQPRAEAAADAAFPFGKTQADCCCYHLWLAAAAVVHAPAPAPAVKSRHTDKRQSTTLASVARADHLELQRVGRASDVHGLAAAAEVLQGKRLPCALQQLHHRCTGTLPGWGRGGRMTGMKGGVCGKGVPATRWTPQASHITPRRRLQLPGPSASHP